MNENKTIDDVRAFWDSSPLGTGFIPHEAGSIEWFNEFDRIKRDYGLLGCLDSWAPSDLHDKRVLDIGCGTGFWARLLIPMGVDYYGIDISACSVELAKSSLELYGLKGALQTGNAESLDFPDTSFDRVISEGVIHHTPNTQACIEEIYRVLKPGGVAAVSVYYKVPLLRSPIAFSAVKTGMRLTGLIQTGRGRESMLNAADPDSFVRMYDGLNNPIGKAYTKQELRSAFSQFSSARFVQYFLPYSKPVVILPGIVRRLLSRMGLMMLVIARK